MGIVSEHLVGLIAKQVEERSLVVWYDPDADFQTVAENLKISGTTIARYEGSFLKLRREIDPLLNGLEAPKLVVYVPVEQADTQHALVELEAAGVVMQPGQQPFKCNTRLALVARNALKSVIGEGNAAEVEKQVDAGKLTLADVDGLGSDLEGVAKGVVSVIFHSGNSQEIALAFLATDRLDGEIDKKAAITELASLLRNTFEVELPDKATLPSIRERLSRNVLLTDLFVGLGEAVPPSLASIKIAGSPAAVAACTTLARSWRLRRDVRDSYIAASLKVEQDFSLSKLPFDATKIVSVETFLALERALLRHVETALLEKATDELMALAKSRLASFWAEAMPPIQAHWALIAAAAEVLLEADRVEKSLKKPPTTVAALMKAYAEGESPWCLLDSHHRHMESRWYKFDPSEDHDNLEKLVNKAERRYTHVGSELAKHFIGQFQKAKHPAKGILRQVDLFETQVQPRLKETKTAYVWVDALRFEMARELAEVLKDDFDLTLQPALATIPTITEIGMASLLPKANQSAKLVSVGNGKLALEVGGTVIKERKDRINFMKAHAGVPVFDAKLDDLLPKPTKKVRDGIQNAQLVLVTSQEIDELCEQDNIPQARRQMDGVLNDLRRGVRVLADLGVRSIVLVADHGHLFGEQIGEDMKIEAPGGDTKDLHRRVWVGVGGNTEPSYLRTSLASLGVESEFDIATPWTFACFKSKGGAKAYFHGGLSPQELVIPVLVLTPKSQRMAGPPSSINWTLLTGAKKLTTRFFSVQITGVGTGLFELEPPKVRVELRSKGKPVSLPVSASYGFEEATGDVTLKLADNDSKKIEPNTVTVMVTLEEDSPPKTVSLVLLDATTGAELVSLDKIENAISL
jgi:PglZ domain